MPLNPNRPFKTVIEGTLALNEDGMWAMFDGDEELSYWDEGQQMEAFLQDAWRKGVVAWEDERYLLALVEGGTMAIVEGAPARRRVGGSI